MRMQEGSLLRGERGRGRVVCWIRHGVLWCLRGGLLRGGGLGGAGRRDEEEVVHAVLCEFCEALTEKRADEELSAGEVGLQD